MSSVSSREPGTYVVYILGVCSDLQNAAVRALTHSQEAPGVEDSNVRARMNKQDGRSSHIDITILTTTALSPDRGSTSDDPVNFSHVTFENGDFATLDDLAGRQWSMPPFWNWQDLNG